MSWLNHRTLVLHPDCESLRDFMLSVPERFDRGEGTVIHKGRNELRKTEVVILKVLRKRTAVSFI